MFLSSSVIIPSKLHSIIHDTPSLWLLSYPWKSHLHSAVGILGHPALRCGTGVVIFPFLTAALWFIFLHLGLFLRILMFSLSLYAIVFLSLLLFGDAGSWCPCGRSTLLFLLQIVSSD